MHFSIGFVAESFPKRSVDSVCSLALDLDNVYSVLNEKSDVMALWPREDGMNCDSHGCLSKGSICAPRGDDTLVIFSVYDTDGDEFDITGAAEIVFIAADTINGTVRIDKRLTTSGVQISTNGYQFSVDLDSVDTEALVHRHNYYEVQVTTSSGDKKTVSSGILLSENTMIKDLA